METENRPIKIKVRAKNYNKILLHENESIAAAYNKFDGFILNEMNLQADLSDMEDFDDLIKFLQVHKHCFVRREIVTIN